MKYNFKQSIFLVINRYELKEISVLDVILEQNTEKTANQVLIAINAV